MLYYHLLCTVSAYLLILYISVSLSVLLPNVANKRVHKSAYLLILYISVSLSVLLPNVANKRVHKRAMKTLPLGN